MRIWERRCDYCEKQYRYMRSTSRFCSTRCRMAHARIKSNAWALLNDIEYSIELFTRLVDKHPAELISPKWVEKTNHLVVLLVNLDKHLALSTSKGISQQMLIDYHEEGRVIKKVRTSKHWDESVDV